MRNIPFNKLTYTVFDTETTGFSSKYAKIVEIAAVKIYTDYQIDYNNIFSTLINPEIDIPYNAYKVHKISNEMVQDKPLIKNVLPDFLSFADKSVFVGHNINFDINFIKKEASSYNIALDFSCNIDTLKLARKAIPELKKYTLDSLINYFNIQLDIKGYDRHRALFDAIHTAIILIECLKILEKQGIYTISHL